MDRKNQPNNDKTKSDSGFASLAPTGRESYKKELVPAKGSSDKTFDASRNSSFSSFSKLFNNKTSK